MKKLLLLMALMLSFSFASYAEEASYTITFNDNGASDATNDITASAVLTYISEGSEYVSSASDISKVYKGKTGLKFSASKKNGSITLNLSEAGQVEATKVVVNAANWVSDKGAYDSASLKVNNLTAQKCSDEFANYTFAITPATKITSIKLDATKRLYVKSITVYYEDNGSTITKEPAGLAFTKEADTANLGEDFTAPELTNPNGLEVTYKSSNEAVATVATDGNVTILAAGTTTITATSAETEKFKAGEASYTLSVVDPNATEATFDFTKARAYGLTPQTGNTYETAVSSIEETPVTISFTGNFRQWTLTNGYELRMHKGSSMTFTVPDTYYITSIEFTGDALTKFTTDASAPYSYSTTNHTVTCSGTDVREVTLRDPSGTGDTQKINTITVHYGLDTTGIADIEAEENGVVEYFNLQGVRVDEPANGLYIRRAGNKVEKVIVR